MDVLAPRYTELLAKLPSGDYYSADGTIIPYSKDLYEFRLTTDSPSTAYLFKVNDTPIIEVVTDVDGSVLVKAELRLGANKLDLTQLGTGLTTTTYVTTRHTAVMHAAYADVLKPLDDGIQLVNDNQYLATVSYDDIDTIWARRLRTKNTPNYPIETYREVLQTIAQAYRYYGSRENGLYKVVSAFTQTNPLVVPFSDGPRWVLGQQLIRNSDFNTKVGIFSGALPNINVNGANVAISADSQAYFASGTYTIDWDSSTRRVSATLLSTYTDTSKIIPLTGNDSFELNVGGGIINLYSKLEPFDTSVKYQLTIDAGHGPVVAVLPQSSTLSAAALRTAIANAIVADPKYDGSGVTVLNSFGHVGISSANGIDILPSISPAGDYSLDAADEIFNLPIGRVTVGTSSAFSSNVGTVQLVSAVGLPPVPFEATIYSAWTDMTVQLPIVGTVTAVNTTTNQITIDATRYNGIHNIAFVLDGTIVAPSVNVNQRFDYSNKLVKFVFSVEDCSKLPATSTSDTITITEPSNVPDNWILSPTNTAQAPCTRWSNNNGQFVISSQPSSLTTLVDVSAYSGRSARLSALIESTTVGPSCQAVVEISYDNGASWVSSTATTIATTTTPTILNCNTNIPAFSTTAIVRVRISTAAASLAYIRVCSVTMSVDSVSALYLGHNTIVRNQHRAKRGYAVYVWSYSPLTTAENEQIGLPQGTRGHIDYISPTSVVLERFDVTDGTNVYGVFTDAEFAAGSLTNMEIVSRAPAEFSYVKPTVSTKVEAETIFPLPTPPYSFSISRPIDLINPKFTVYENGIPVLSSLVGVIDANTLQLLYPTDNTKVYTIDYTTLIRFESADIALGANWQDYQWYADIVTHSTLNTIPMSVPLTVGVEFDANYRAVIKIRSDADRSQSSLIADDGISTTTVPESQWEYIDATTISINPATFNSDSIYTLTYNGRLIYHTPRPAFTAEIKQADSPAALLSATYESYDVNQTLLNKRFVKFRFTVNSCENPDDLKLHSVSVRGLNLYGIGGSTPFLR